MSLIINTLLNIDSYRVGIVNGSRTIKLPLVSNANRNKGNNKITELRAILQRESQNSYNCFTCFVQVFL
jgi:hypothetical protein